MLDTSILNRTADGVAPPANPLAPIGQVQQMQGQQQIQAQRGIQMQGEQTENNLKSLALGQGQQQAQDQSTVRAGYAAATDPQTGQVDRQKLISTLAALNPMLAAQTKQGLDTQDAAVAEAKDKASKVKADAVEAHLELKDKLLQGTNAATWPNTRAIALQSGFTPQEIPEQYPGDAWVAQAHAQTQSQKDILAQQNKVTEQTETAKKDQATADLAKAAQANTQAHQKVEEQQGAQRIGIEAGRLSLEKQKQNVDQGGSIEAMAQQVASGDVKKPTITRNNPFNQAVLQRAYEINPKLTDEAYTTKQDYLSSKGKANANIQSFNKVAEHLHDVREASDAAGFTPFGVMGAGKALSTAEQVFGTEDIKYLSGTGVGSQPELEKLHNNIHSPIASIRADALDQLEKMTASAGRQIGSNYERGTNQPFDAKQFFNNQAQGILQRHGEPVTGGASQGNAAPEGTIVQTKDGPMIKRGGQWTKP